MPGGGCSPEQTKAALLLTLLRAVSDRVAYAAAKLKAQATMTWDTLVNLIGGCSKYRATWRVGSGQREASELAR